MAEGRAFEYREGETEKPREETKKEFLQLAQEIIGPDLSDEQRQFGKLASFQIGDKFAEVLYCPEPIILRADFSGEFGNFAYMRTWEDIGGNKRRVRAFFFRKNREIEVETKIIDKDESKKLEQETKTLSPEEEAARITKSWAETLGSLQVAREIGATAATEIELREANTILRLILEEKERRKQQ